jgi:hypothetical protein
MDDPIPPSTMPTDEPWADVEYNTLILLTKDYIVCIDPKKELFWDTTPSFDDKHYVDSKFDRTKHSDIFSEVALLEAHARKDLDEGTRIELLCLIGNAVVFCFDFDYTTAQKALAAARQFLMERSEEISRSWYLTASFVTTFCFMASGLIMWTARSWVERVVGDTVLWLCLSGVAGATGALLSVILRSGNLNVQSSAGRRLHYLEGSSRIAAGVLSGLIVSLAIKTGLILASLAPNQPRSMMILAAMAAGASERLATSIIAQIDSGDKKKRALLKKRKGAP